MTNIPGRFRARNLMHVLALIAITLLVGRQALPSAAGPQPFDPKTGYRVSQLRDPVPEHLDGAEVLDVDKLEALLQTSKPLLVDVYDDRPGRLERWSFGLLHTPEHRMNIAGSITMAGLGQASLSDEEARAFKRRLDEATGGDDGRPIVFYCLVNCWTSWNAARRAIAMGYRDVKWFRDGVETWSDAGLPTAAVVHGDHRPSSADFAMSHARR